MSVIASIDVTFFKEYQLLDVVKEMTDDAWSIGSEQISYILSKDDLDKNGWRDLALSQWSDIEKEIRQSEKEGNNPGIILLYKDSLSGIELMKESPRKLSICVSTGRRSLYENVTDYSWYLGKIAPLVKRCGDIECICCEDIY